MNKEEILEKLKGIVVSQLSVKEEDIKLESTLVDDLSADSLDIVELVMAVEEEFGVSIPDSEAEKIVTVEDVVNYIVEKQS